MSVKLMGIVYDADLPRNEKSILLSYADHASHDGSNIYPSIGYTSWKTGYSDRSVQLITSSLVERGVLVPDGIGPYGQNRYRLNTEKLPTRPPYVGGEKTAPPPARGEEISPPGVKNLHPGGEEFAPKPLDKPIDKPSVEEGSAPALVLMVNALADVTGMSGSLNWKDLKPLAEALVKDGYEPEKVTAWYGPGGWWYANDWRGKRGDLPDEKSIRKTIMAARNGMGGAKAVALANGSQAVPKGWGVLAAYKAQLEANADVIEGEVQ